MLGGSDLCAALESATSISAICELGHWFDCPALVLCLGAGERFDVVPRPIRLESLYPHKSVLLIIRRWLWHSSTPEQTWIRFLLPTHGFCVSFYEPNSSRTDEVPWTKPRV